MLWGLDPPEMGMGRPSPGMRDVDVGCVLLAGRQLGALHPDGVMLPSQLQSTAQHPLVVCMEWGYPKCGAAPVGSMHGVGTAQCRLLLMGSRHGVRASRYVTASLAAMHVSGSIPIWGSTHGFHAWSGSIP